MLKLNEVLNEFEFEFEFVYCTFQYVTSTLLRNRQLVKLKHEKLGLI